MEEPVPPAEHRPPSALADLARLQRHDGLGINASSDVSFGNAVFGRDSAVTAEDLLERRPSLAREVILTLARLQGTRETPAGSMSNEEEVGRIHHELRLSTVDGSPLPPWSQERYLVLAAHWGECEMRLPLPDGTLAQRRGILYFGSVDSTPLFVRLVGRYCDQESTAILDEVLVNKDGTSITVRDSVVAAARWIERRLRASTLGLLEFQASNPRGLPFQAWKDSEDAYLHSDGTPANREAPIASVEVQGYAYDALLAACTLLDDRRGRVSDGWAEAAIQLRQQTVRRFWMPRLQFFAMAIDRHPETGRVRQVDTLTSNGAVLLDSRLLLDLPDQARRRYLTGIATMICSSEFLTDAGVRCRARSDDLVDFADYHGSRVTWIKDTWDVAKGLRRHGLPRVAAALERRILNAVNIAGVNYEYLFVGATGTVDYDPHERRAHRRRETLIPGVTLPERVQAWTASAVLAIKGGHPGAPVLAPAGWPRALERALVSFMPRTAPMEHTADANAAFQRSTHFHVDTALGRRREDQQLQRWSALEGQGGAVPPRMPPPAINPEISPAPPEADR